MARLAGKIAIVTGAASGIGAASAKLFADEGAQVLAVDRPESQIAGVHDGNAAIASFAADITGDDAPRRIVEAALAKFGALDILFNNAGVSGRAFVEEMTDAEWDRVNGVNVRGMFRLCREAIPALKRRAKEKGRARIVNTASVMAFDTDTAWRPTAPPRRASVASPARWPSNSASSTSRQTTSAPARSTPA